MPNFPSREELIQASLEQKNMRLRQLEAPYINAQKFLQSPEWQAKRDRALIKIQEAMGPYQGKDATEAVYILGKLRAYMLEIQEPTDVIIEYEGLKREIENYYAARGE